MHDNQVPYHEIINLFCDHFKYKTYLELGLRSRENTFDKVNCPTKTSVDINPSCGPTFSMSTDNFFDLILPPSVRYDIIFIDANHDAEFVRRDFENALRVLSHNGTIIMDDINPTQEFLLKPEWCGTAWEVFCELGNREDLYMRTVVPSFTGFVRRGKQIPHNLKLEKTFQFLETNRNEITKPITLDELKKEIICYQ